MGISVDDVATLSSSYWRDGEICELLTIMEDKEMQSHLTKTGKDGAIYKKVVTFLRRLSSR